MGVEHPGFGRPKEIVRDIYEINPNVIEGIFQVLEQRGLRTPVSNLIGFGQFLGKVASRVNTIETTTSTSYTDLATAGPTLSSLADGNYLVFHGCRSAIAVLDGSDQARMAISVNGAASSDNECASSSWAGFNTVMMLNAYRLASGSNSLAAKYKSNVGATASFGTRWLIAVRYANL